MPAGEGLPRALEVKLKEELSVKATDVAMGVEEALREARAEGVAEGQGLREVVGVSRGEKDLLPGSGALAPGLGVREAVMLMLRVAVGEVEEEAQDLALGVICGEEDCAGELERVPLGDTVAVQEGGASKPGCEHCEQPVQGMGEVRLPVGQKLPMGQVRHVVLRGAPVALLKVPAGQGVG